MGGKAFRRPSPSITITTDASRSGWGATLGPRQAVGCWGPEHRGLHINILELLAVANALAHFQYQVMGHTVQIQCDNTTVVAYINRQGGTRSPQLCAHTWKLLHWCVRNRVDLTAVHLPGEYNVDADALSRGWIRPTEWSLLPQVVQSLFNLIDRPPCGPLRLAGQLPAARILLEGERPRRMEVGCPLVPVGRPPGICLPPDLVAPTCSHKGGRGGLQDPPHCPLLASPAMVRSTDPAARSSTGDPAAAVRSSSPARLRSSSSSPPGSPPDVLGIVTQTLQSAGLSARAASIAACSRRASTQQIGRASCRERV